MPTLYKSCAHAHTHTTVLSHGLLQSSCSSFQQQTFHFTEFLNCPHASATKLLTLTSWHFSTELSWDYWTNSAQVQVILRPTVSWPVRLRVVPLLERMARCHIFFSDNYFLSFSCRAPSLMRGQVVIRSAMTHVRFQVIMRPTVCQPVCLGAGILISLFDNFFSV
jgi:hypothetical protein